MLSNSTLAALLLMGCRPAFTSAEAAAHHNKAAPETMTKRSQSIAVSLPQSCVAVQQCREIFEKAHNPNVIRDAALTLTNLNDPAALKLLGERLSDARFLGQLDPNLGTDNLRAVFRALENHPSTNVAALCLKLSKNHNFLKIDERLLPLLKTLAAIKPMSAESVALFEEQNERGYATSNAILLGENASPKALELFETLLYQKGMTLQDQVDVVHIALLPVRTEASIIDAVTRWLSQENPAGLELALVETIFDHKSAAWFGKQRHPPTPPKWIEASKESLQKALKLSKQQHRNKRIPASLHKVLGTAINELTRVLDAK